jgi:Ca-activated chloride channel family protein
MKLIVCFSIILFSFKGFCQDATASISKGNQYYQQAQFEMAEKQYRKALETEPANATAQYNLANALQRQKKYDEAIELLDKLSASAKEKNFKSSSFYNQGVAYTKLKNLESSIESYKNALRQNPNDLQARENLQKALLELKKNQSQSQQNQKPQSNMSQKEAEQKLKQLQQKEKDLQQKMQSKNKQQGGSQSQDW